MSVRVKTALYHATAVALLLLLFGGVWLLIEKIKRERQLTDYSSHIGRQISSTPFVRDYLLEQEDGQAREEVRLFLERLIEGNPFVTELILVGPYHKMLYHIAPGREDGGPEAAQAPPFSIQEFIASDDQGFVREYGEYPVPLEDGDRRKLGWIRLHWNDAATGGYFDSLRRGMLIAAAAAFVLTFLLSNHWLLRGYQREYKNLSGALSKIISGNYSLRIDSNRFSRDIAEIGTYMNRILTEFEDAKKRLLVLEDAKRQAERNYSESLVSLDQKTLAIESVYNELRQGLRQLFSIMWNGVMIVDEEYRIHWMNEQAERLLRFARHDGETLEDERLRRCLAPLVRLGKTTLIDDVCSWPQSSMNEDVSCRVRAARIPVKDDGKAFFVLLREESGYPRQHGAEFFAHRFMTDILKQDVRDNGASIAGLLRSDPETLDCNERARFCLERIKRFRAYELEDFGDPRFIRLSAWLGKRFRDIDYDRIEVEAHPQESDIPMMVPEALLSDLVDMALEIIFSGPMMEARPDRVLSIRTRLNARGKPVIEFSVPGARRSDNRYFRETFGGRTVPICDRKGDEPVTLEELETDARHSLFHFVSQILRAQVECVSSESKQLATVQLTIDRHQFPRRSGGSGKEDPREGAGGAPRTVDLITRNFLEPR